MPSETTTACARLFVFFRIGRSTFPYGVEDDASTISQTPTTHYTSTCVKLTIVTYLSFSERIAIANLSCCVIYWTSINYVSYASGLACIKHNRVVEAAGRALMRFVAHLMLLCLLCCALCLFFAEHCLFSDMLFHMLFVPK